jgi:hypothetical protein
MSPIFGKKKTKGGKTVAIVDVESGSVASALARLSRGEAPRLFAEIRVPIPILHTRDSVALAHAVEKAAEEALSHTSEVAARIRAHGRLAEQGEIERAAIFFAPPWASMHLSGGTADYAEPLERMARSLAHSLIGDVPITFHPHGTAAAHGAVLIYPSDAPTVVCIVSGEVSEILLVSPGQLLGRATVPVGQRTLLRTLVSHGGVSSAEALSYLALANRDIHPLSEPLASAEDHFASLVADAARDLKGAGELSGIIVLAQEPTSELYARALGRHAGMAELFPQGGTVRAMRPAHAMPYIAAHARMPDLTLLLETLFVNAKFAR